MIMNRLGVTGMGIIALVLTCQIALRPGVAFGVGLNPTTGVGPKALDFWAFSDTNWVTQYGNLPISFSNLVNVPYLGDGNCLLLDSAQPAWLQYSLTHNGTNRLTVDTGTVVIWFASSWSGTNAGGQGPGSYGRLIEVGNYTADASIGWWSLYFSPAGDRIFFSAQTNGAGATYLSAPVSLATNRWHQIVLSYGTNTALYWDGALLTNGPALAYWPGAEVLSNGVSIGSDSETGLAQARGMFDDIVTYSSQLDTDTLLTGFLSGFPFYANTLNEANWFASAPSQPSWTPVFNAITGPGYLVPVSTNLAGCVTNS